MVRQLPNPTLARAVSGSRVLHVIDAVVPSWMAGWAGGFRQAVSDSPFPRVFEGVARERIQPVSHDARRGNENDDEGLQHRNDVVGHPGTELHVGGAID